VFTIIGLILALVSLTRSQSEHFIHGHQVGRRDTIYSFGGRGVFDAGTNDSLKHHRSWESSSSSCWSFNSL
jgi:hypothetical protein